MTCNCGVTKTIIISTNAVLLPEKAGLSPRLLKKKKVILLTLIPVITYKNRMPHNAC